MTKTLSAIATIILLVVIIYTTPFLSWVSKGIHSLGENIWHAKENIQNNLEDNAQLIGQSKARLIDRINDLEEQLAYYKAQSITVARLQQKNQALQGMQDTTEEGVITRVISRPPQSVYDTVVLDAGANKGVKTGDEVVGFGAVTLGTVTRTTPMTAVTSLYSKPGVETQVLQVESNTAMEAIGRGKGHYLIKVPRGVSIEEKDQFVHQKSGKLIAVVTEVEFDAQDPFKKAYAESPLSLRRLEWVRVLPR